MRVWVLVWVRVRAHMYACVHEFVSCLATMSSGADGGRPSLQKGPSRGSVSEEAAGGNRTRLKGRAGGRAGGRGGQRASYRESPATHPDTLLHG